MVRDMQKPTSLNPNIIGFVISNAGKRQMGSDYGEFQPISLETFKVAALIWTHSTEYRGIFGGEISEVFEA